jgi:hypothetical protein
MDERVMLRWVEDVLAPYVALAPPGIIPVILLDSFRCHIMASAVNVIQDLGCKVVHIPGGCTGLVQPLDVGYNNQAVQNAHSRSLGEVHDQQYAREWHYCVAIA